MLEVSHGSGKNVSPSAPQVAPDRGADVGTSELLARLETALARLQSQLDLRDRELARLRAVEAVAVETLRDLDGLIDAESHSHGHGDAACGAVVAAKTPTAGVARRGKLPG